DRYQQLAEACDQILKSPESSIDWIAIPWLHILSEHPLLLKNYHSILNENGDRHSRDWFGRLSKSFTRHQIALILDLAHSAIADLGGFRDDHSEFAQENLPAVDVVIVSLLNQVEDL